jgi:hypothetical protein
MSKSHRRPVRRQPQRRRATNFEGRFHLALSFAECLDDCTPENTFFRPEPITMVEFLEYAATDPHIRNVTRGLGDGRWLCQLADESGEDWVYAWFQLLPVEFLPAQ